MRILALHGNRQNGEVFRTRLGPVVRRLEDAGHRVFFVDAPHELPMGPGDEVPMRTWWTREGGDGAGTSGWDESLAALRGVWTSRGPFQGIVGFSQGAAAGLILSELADAADASFASLRCAVLCAGYVVPSRDAIDRPAISDRHVRVMLIAGDADEAVPPAETLACASRVHPSTTTIYRHPGNHVFPAKSRDARAVADFFDAEEVGTLEVGTLPGDGDGDGDVIPEEVAEELAALAAIFDEEMRTEGSTTLSFTLPGVAEAMDPTDPSSYDPRLVLILPREYPAALPTTSLRGIPREIADRMSRLGLEATAREAGEACGGGAALFSIVSEVREWAEGAARRAVAAGDFATVGEPRDDDGVDEDNEDEGDGDEDDDDADDDEVEVGRWWESEDTDPALVEAATMEALDAETRLRRAQGTDAPFVVGAGGGRWTFVVGLVGKPSAGKSTFFNAARELVETDRGAARCAPHPFTTIEPNVGRAFAPVPCPCAAAGLRGTCDPAHGSEDVDGEHCRRIPVLVKDVAGLVPGAHAGRGRGNAFLNDLCDADVLVHVVDASGRTDREGVDQVGDSGVIGDSGVGVAGDIQWVREELHRWIFGNVRRKWRTVRRRPERLQDLFVGYHCVRATVDAALDRMPNNVPDPRGGITRERALAWTERELHLLVAHFLRVRFPILLALNKADVVGADVGIAAVRARWPGEPSVPTSARLDPGGVRRALKAAVGLKPPTLGFPVDDLDTGASRGGRRGGGGGGVGTADDASTERVGSLRECVVLRPGSTAWDLFGAVQSRGGGGETAGDGGSVVAARGEFVRAECRDGPGGCRRRLMRRDEAIHEGNCVVKFYVNRKASWQGKKK